MQKLLNLISESANADSTGIASVQINIISRIHLRRDFVVEIPPETNFEWAYLIRNAITAKFQIVPVVSYNVILILINSDQVMLFRVLALLSA